ncbi:hypothetical protein [Actinoplanes subglobosus]|uniref:Uncharacterized protein n=1 Tax=Actinoplanes subglobosus TaxID=1547892 RepID=A0ABV8IZS3_9ACTN
MHPYPPRAPEPSFLEREIAGVPLYVHLIAVFATCGVYLILLPFVLVFGAIDKGVSRAVDRVVDPLLDKALKAALVVVTIPAVLVYMAGEWLYKRYKRRAGKPEGA